MQSLQELVVKKLKEESFPSFCQLLPPLESPSAGKEFLLYCLGHYFMHKTTDLTQHADVYWPPKPGGTSGYKMEELKEFFTFTQSRPFHEKCKFAIFEFPEMLSQSILNKWLKTLEEPPSYLQIFFLNSSHKKLLSTIESRSIKIRLPLAKNSGKAADQLSTLGNEKLQQINDKLKALREEERWSIFSEALKQEEKNWDYHFSERCLGAMEKLEQSQTFHNQPMQRYLPFLGQIKAISSPEFGQSE